jgi:hypothetical protein
MTWAIQFSMAGKVLASVVSSETIRMWVVVTPVGIPSALGSRKETLLKA